MRQLGLAVQLLLELALLGFALLVAVGSLAAQTGRWIDRYDLFTHVALIWLAGGVLVLVLGLLHRCGWRKVAVLALGGVTVAAAGDLIAPEFTRARSPLAAADAPCQVKIVSFNAWAENSNPQVVARWVADQHPDLIVINEPNDQLLLEIPRLTGLETWKGGDQIIASRAGYISSRRSWDARFLPGASVGVAWDRILIFPDLPITLLGVHAGWPIPARMARGQDLRLVSILNLEDRASAIMVGDYNSTEWSFRQRQADAAFGLERRDRAIPTWPARIPRWGKPDFPVAFMPIDHVYAGSNWRTVSVERGPRLGSDHYPLITRLAWAGPLSTERMRRLCAR